MSDAETLALLLALVYLADCVLWVRTGGVLLRRAWLGAWRADVFRETSAVMRGGLVPGSIVPPLSGAIVVPSWIVSLAPQGVLTFAAAGPGRDAAPQDVALVPWESLRRVDVSGAELRAGGRVLGVATSEAAAASLADRIEAIAETKPDARPAAIRALVAATLDTAAVTRAHREAEAATRAHGIVADIQFVLLAAVVAALAGWEPARRIWLPVAAAALVAHVVAVVLARRAHRRLHPTAVTERRRLTWTAALSPLSAVKAADSITRDVLVGCDPLVAVRAACEPDAFRRFASLHLADLHEPKRPACPGAVPGAAEAESWFRAVLREETEAWLRREGEDPAAILAPPAKRGDRVVSWCPRCRTCYEIPPGACADCGGIPLVAYAA